MQKFEFVYSLVFGRLRDVEEDLLPLEVTNPAYAFYSGRKSAFKEIKSVMDAIKD